MATVFEASRFKLTTNEATPTKVMQIGPGDHRIDIIFGAAASGTITPKQTADHNNPNGYHDCKENGSAISVTGTYSFVIVGPCFLGFVVSGISGTVEVQANEA